MKNLLQILWFAMTALPCLVTAQQEEAPNFTRYTMEQGLADNWVHVAMRDSHGFLWFGTEGGLSRLDGQTFLNFYEQKDAPHSLSNNTIRDMCEDPQDGAFWLAVLDGGLNRFDPATGKFEAWATDPDRPDMKGQLLSLTSVCQDGDLLWLGSYHHGLGCFDKKKRRYTGWYSLREDSLKANSFQYNAVNHVIPDRGQEGFLWVAAAGRGLARFDKSKRSFDIIQIEDYHKMPGVATMKLLEDERGMVWIATWSAGVASYDPAARQVKTFPYDLPQWKKTAVNRNVALAIREKSANELWVGTQDSGFGIFEKNSGKYHFFESALSGESPELDRNCQGLFLDPEQRLWVLGVDGGVRSFDFQNESFRYLSLASGGDKTERTEVTGFAFDPLRKLVFVATKNSGCYEWSVADKRLTQRAKPISGGIFPNFRVVLHDEKGNTWAGAVKTLGGEASLYLLHPDSPDHGRGDGQAFFEPVLLRLSPPRVVEETVNDLFEDSKGNIWVATNYDGVYKISPPRPGSGREAKHFSQGEDYVEGAHAFKNWWAFMEIAEDRRGHLWLALKSGGVLDFDPEAGSFLKYDNGNVLMSNNSRAMEIGNDGSLWLGTNNSGLQRFMPGEQAKASFRLIGKSEGLPGNHVSGIEKDERGNLWMATNQGLAMCDPAGKQFKVFAQAEGLKAPYLIGKGLAIFPGLGVLVGQPNGFCLLRQISSAPVKTAAPVKVALTDFRIFDRSEYFKKNIRNAREIVLEPSENVFSFEFAAPVSFNADLVGYQFMLEGLDEKWYAAEGRKSLTYTGLQPGSYTFRVKANQAGTDSSPETTLNIRILPHWWQTWWFWTAVALAGVLAVWAFIRYHISQVRHEEQLKTEFYKKLSETEMTALRSQMNPHFIFNCLNSINHFVVRNDSEQAANYISKFSRLMRLVLDNSRLQKVPLEKDLEALKLYMDLEAMRFGGKFRHELWVDDDIDAQFTQIPPMLLQPYVENAIWHGLMHKPEGGSVVVDVRQPDENLLHIEITDDGVGRQRAAELESKSSLQHKPQGTLITAERLRMLNPDKPNGGKVTIEDLVDAEGQPCGTKVVLEIPV